MPSFFVWVKYYIYCRVKDNLKSLFRFISLTTLLEMQRQQKSFTLSAKESNERQKKLKVTEVLIYSKKITGHIKLIFCLA